MFVLLLHWTVFFATTETHIIDLFLSFVNYLNCIQFLCNSCMCSEVMHYETKTALKE